MDISEVVECIPHNLFMACSYGFYITFVYSFLKRRKQNVKIDNVLSPFQPLISGVKKRFNFTSNIFLNDVVTTLENESENTIDWFRLDNKILQRSENTGTSTL